MPIKSDLRFDSMLLSAICAEAKEKIVNGRAVQVRQIGEYEILMKITGATGTSWLLISAHPKYAHLNICSTAPQHAERWHSSFLFAMQRCVEGAKVRAIEQLDFDRLVRIEFIGRNEIGDAVRFYLMVELMGKHSNIVLVNEEGRIIDALKRLPSSINRYREVLPGRVYIRPPSHGCINPILADQEKIERALQAASREMTLRQWLQTTFHGMSDVLSSELLFKAGANGDEQVGSISSEQIEGILNALFWLQRIVAYGQFNPVCIRFSGSDKLIGCYPIELGHLLASDASENIIQEQCHSLCECISRWIGQRRFSDEFEQLKRSIQSRLERALRKLDERICSLQAQLEEAQLAEEWRVKGELLLSHAHEIEAGTTEVTLDDYRGGKVKIQLEPKLSPIENAQRYFAKYRHLKGARLHLSEVIANLTALAEKLRMLLKRLEGAQDMSALEEIRKGAEQLGLAKDSKVLPSADSGVADKLLRFTVADGFELFVGRSEHENMELITRVAKPDDLWMHVRGASGAHGILRRHSRASEFTQRAIEEAARIVAMRSKCKGKVAVDYTLAKYVRPIKGKQGKVTYTNHRTVVVNVDAQ
ncbi:MAG: NFACT RNA binding domain-containing protein [Armatimonadota bacterium]|nr:NFACT family protein [Armatimonadota bacterium]MCX7777230.1 NFACT family protein [Armatimonadota bacterium]MDW8024645.1 NFACT RNA binding domain-containing protein [Armatimonadota bacterium]